MTALGARWHWRSLCGSGQPADLSLPAGLHATSPTSSAPRPTWDVLHAGDPVGVAGMQHLKVSAGHHLALGACRRRLGPQQHHHTLCSRYRGG